MALENLYSRRNRKNPDVYTYEALPLKLKVQIIRILQKFDNQSQPLIGSSTVNHYWMNVKEALCDEYGKDHLVYGWGPAYVQNEIKEFLERSDDIEQCLDIVELGIKYILHHHKPNFQYGSPPYSIHEAIEDINARFLENGVGFEYRDGEIIRIDNKLLHQDVIIPALHFLSASEFSNANEEYLNAHDHFRHGRTKACLVDCLKAMESTIKVICDINNWPYKQTDNVSKLIGIIIEHRLVPEYLLQHFSSIRSSLECGVPTLRNKMAGHGAGVKEVRVPMHYASYMLYLTGTTINFLVSCQQEQQSN